jgi:predicted DNA-binding WGR domain protein
MLVLERRDASINIARFYVLAIEPTLFGDTAVVREWGRIGFLGCRRLDLYPDHRGRRRSSRRLVGSKVAAWLSSPSVKLVVLIGADGTRRQ